MFLMALIKWDLEILSKAIDFYFCVKPLLRRAYNLQNWSFVNSTFGLDRLEHENENIENTGTKVIK